MAQADDKLSRSKMSDSLQFSSSRCKCIRFYSAAETYAIGSDIECLYSVNEEFEASPSDFIGLYKVGWTSTSDFVTCVLSPPLLASHVTGLEAVDRVTFPAKLLPAVEDGEFYQFCYVAAAGELRGVSQPFQFVMSARDEPFEIEEKGGDRIVGCTETFVEENLTSTNNIEQPEPSQDCQPVLPTDFCNAERESQEAESCITQLTTELATSRQYHEKLSINHEGNLRQSAIMEKSTDTDALMVSQLTINPATMVSLLTIPPLKERCGKLQRENRNLTTAIEDHKAIEARQLDELKNLNLLLASADAEIRKVTAERDMLQADMEKMKSAVQQQLAQNENHQKLLDQAASYQCIYLEMKSKYEAAADLLNQQTSDEIELEDYLWRYVEKHYIADFIRMCGPDVQYAFDHQTQRLRIARTGGKTVVAHVCSVLKKAFQDLRTRIHQIERPLPPHADEDCFVNMALSVVERENSKSIFYIKRPTAKYYVVGPMDEVTKLNDEIFQLVNANPRAAVAETDGFLHFITPNSIVVQVSCQDLTQENVDVIVNPTNAHLQHGGGAAKKIASLAGPQLLKQCADYIQKHKELKVTQVMYTTAGNLSPRIKYVIHAAGPQANLYRDHVELRSALVRTFLNCLQYADKGLQARSISIPPISAGTFRIPPDLVANAAFDALITFDGEVVQPSGRLIREVHFVDINPKTIEVFIRTFRNRCASGLVASVQFSSSADRSPQLQIHNGATGSSAIRPTSSASSPSPTTAAAAASMPTTITTEDCVICMCPITNVEQLPCGHKFCTSCITEAFSKCQPKCPICGRLYGVMKGNQPPGTMTHRISALRLAGYEGFGAIEIQYNIPDGIQTNDHPNPGAKYHGVNRTAYLPANADGQEVLKLLQQAFNAGLIFTVGRSNTTGKDNAVIWNDIHHKTNTTGQYGYPDAGYLSRVKQELADKGIRAH